MNKVVTVLVPLLADGTSDTAVIDLAKDPFWIGDVPSGVSPAIRPENFFADEVLKSLPVGIAPVGSPFSGISVSSSTLSGTVITVVFASAPPASATGVLHIQLLF